MHQDNLSGEQVFLALSFWNAAGELRKQQPAVASHGLCYCGQDTPARPLGMLT
jgi:hypothetical protein